MYYPYFPNYLSPKRKKNPFDLPEDPIKKQMPAADFAKAATVMPDSASYFQHMGAYLEGLTVDEQSQQFGTTPASMIPAVELIDYKLHNRQPFTPPGTKLGFDMARSNAALAAPEAPDATTQIAGTMQKPPASMLTPASTPTQPRQPAQSAQPPASGAPRFPQPGDPIPGWVHQLGEDVVNDFQDFVQYIKTASLKEQQEIALEFGIVAASFLPGAGDAIGVGADLAGLRHEENRNAVYLGLTLLGAVPFVPPFNRIRKIKRLIRTGAEKWRRRKGMRRANQNPPANVPANQFDDVASARNVDLDPDLLVVQAQELGKDAANSIANSLSGFIGSQSRALGRGIMDLVDNPQKLYEIAAEAGAAVASQVLARALLQIDNIAEGAHVEASEGALSGLIGVNEEQEMNQFLFELLNAVAFDMVRSAGSVADKKFLSSLGDSVIVAIETAITEGTRVGVRWAFDRVDRSKHKRRTRILLAGGKQFAASGAAVGALAGFRYLMGTGTTSEEHANSFSGAVVSSARDIYGSNRH